METINCFRGEYAWLSNFHKVTVKYEDTIYPSVENAYVAAKSVNLTDRMKVVRMSAKDAKKYGQEEIELRPDWNKIKYDVMEDLLRQKFAHPELAQKLLATGEANIVEGNYWHDNTWGQCSCANCEGQGKNMLGVMLMKIRDELRSKLNEEIQTEI